MNTTLYPCPFTSTICEIFNCSNRASWYVGRVDGPASASFRICEACAKHMIANAPAELIEGERDIRTELEAEFGMKFADIKAEHETEVQQLYKKWSAEQTAPWGAGKIEEAAIPVLAAILTKPEEEKPVNEGIFRCLDCDKEFDNKRALSNHMRIHAEGVKA